MPSFVVQIKIAGPFRDLSDGERFDGAYSQRVVSAADELAAARRAVKSLLEEPQFAQLRLLNGIGAPLPEIEEVRQARWYERFSSTSPLVFRRESPAPSR